MQGTDLIIGISEAYSASDPAVLVDVEYQSGYIERLRIPMCESTANVLSALYAILALDCIDATSELVTELRKHAI